MSKEQLSGIIRAVVAAVGGYLVGRGVVDSANMELIGGAAATIATAVWSVYSNRKG